MSLPGVVIVFHEDHMSFPCESQLGIITAGQSTSNMGVILSANVTGTGIVTLLQLALNRNCNWTCVCTMVISAEDVWLLQA
jgi:hypothetical protein